MKKILISFFAFAFLLGAVSVMAKTEKSNADFSKLLKVSDFKIEKKQVISDSERQMVDEMLKGKSGESAKGKPIPSPLPPLPAPVVSGATGTVNSQVVDNAKKYAIVIGLSNYLGTANDLCVAPTSKVNTLCADGDSLNMKAVLEKDGYQDNNIHMFRDFDTNFSAIQSAVANIVSTAGSDSEIIFFFSGHSTTTTSLADDPGVEHLGLALYNASGGDIIWDEQLENWFSVAQTSRIIFAFDTCYAGQLEPFLKGAGREVVMSSTADQSSYTYSLGGYKKMPGEGLFTHYFAKQGILNGLADGYNELPMGDTFKLDGKVAVEEAFSYTYPIVKVKQTPVLNDQFSNDLVF